MVRKTVHFLGLLSNVNSSIMRLKLDHGFTIETISRQQGADFVARLENISEYEAQRKLFLNYRCIRTSEDKMYAVSNTFETDVDESRHIADSLFTPTAAFENEKVRGYLLDLLRLMRFFKHGNVCMPLWYYFLIEGNALQHFMSNFSSFSVSEEEYSLDENVLQALSNFLKATKLPFKTDFLNLAFENFELSYDVIRLPLAFLSLMICLETLLNPSDHEIRYRTSRNAAVLLGKSNEDSKSISSEVKELYDKRSTLVHTGRADIVKDDVRSIRGLVRESIKTIYKIGLGKTELMALLDSTGYDNKPWLVETTQAS